MSISLAPQFTQRNYTWADWKAINSYKKGIYQHDDDGIIYTIWFYDEPEVHVCQIWKGNVPDSVLLSSSIITQEQNDLDKADFEDNYLSNSNQVINQMEEQRKSIFEVDCSNYTYPASGPFTVYLAIPLNNPDGYYRHTAGTVGVKIYGVNCISVRTNSADKWVTEIGIIANLENTTASILFTNIGCIYLSEGSNGTSSLTNLQFPIYLDCSIVDGYGGRTTGGIRFENVPGVGSSIPMINATGNTSYPQVGDIIITVSCVSDAAGFTPTMPSGLSIFQYHLWYTVE